MLQPLQGCFRFPREPGVRFATPGYPLESLRDRGKKSKAPHFNRSRSRSRSRTGPSRNSRQSTWIRGGDVLIALCARPVPSLPDPLRRLRHEDIPEGWEPIAPGRAKHAPWEEGPAAGISRRGAETLSRNHAVVVSRGAAERGLGHEPCNLGTWSPNGDWPELRPRVRSPRESLAVLQPPLPV